MKKLILLSIGFLPLVSSVHAHPAISIVIDNDGNVYFSDLENVWKIDRSGSVTIAVRNVHTHQLLLDEDGCLMGENVWYIENGDIWAHYLWQLNVSGEFSKLTGDIMEFPVNNYLVQDTDGNSFYAESAGEGEGELLVRERIDGIKKPLTDEKFTDIRWIQFSKVRNSLLVVDMTTLKEVCLDGKVATIASDFGSNTIKFSWVKDMHKIMGSWTDTEGNIYTCLFGAQKVVIIDKDGNVNDFIKIEGKWAPSGGVFDKEGNLWLLEYAIPTRARVRKISPEGISEMFYPE